LKATCTTQRTKTKNKKTSRAQAQKGTEKRRTRPRRRPEIEQPPLNKKKITPNDRTQFTDGTSRTILWGKERKRTLLLPYNFSSGRERDRKRARSFYRGCVLRLSRLSRRASPGLSGAVQGPVCIRSLAWRGEGGEERIGRNSEGRGAFDGKDSRGPGTKQEPEEER